MRGWAASLALLATVPAWAAGDAGLVSKAGDAGFVSKAGDAGFVSKAGDAGRGEGLFQAHCYACHSVDPAETGLPGPSLFRVLGRKAASLPGFDYSPALREAGQRGLIWTADQAARLIANPEVFLPGTEMTFPGLDSPAERADIVAFLRLAATR